MSSADLATNAASPSAATAPRCRRCDYCLTGLIELRCPECGQPFDPTDPTTVRSGESLPMLVRFVLTPPGRPTQIAALLCAAVFLFSECVPGGFFPVTMFSVFAGLVVGGLWLLRVLLGVLVGAAYGRSLFAQRSSSWRWLFVPAVGGATLLLLWLELPVRVTFYASVIDMNRVARQVTTSPSTVPTRKYIGVFPVERLESIAGGMRFLVSGSGFLDPGGFAYSPNGPPPRIGEDYYTHLHGPWYVWIESW